MRLFEIKSAEDIVKLVQATGFLPFFANGIRGFSVEECCPRELCPWEWKGPAIRSGKCFYGKFFNGKAGFISREWFPHFANFRRDGYDFDSRCDEGPAPFKDKNVYETITKKGKLLSKELKYLCNFRKGGNTGFETIITRLQMQTYVVISDFVYMRDKFGKIYGWGVSEYSTPEKLAGYEFATSAYKTAPSESYAEILRRLKDVLPEASDRQIAEILKP